MIITLTMNPAIDKTAVVEELKVGELNRLENVITDAAGKGINVSKTIKAIGGESVAYSIVAGNNGESIKRELNQLNITNYLYFIDGNTRVNLKVLNKDKELTELNETGPSPSVDELKEFTDYLIQQLNKDDILVISGSVPKGIPTNYYFGLIQDAKKKKVKTLLDADGLLFEEGVKAGPSIIKPNRFELCQYFNCPETVDDIEIIKMAHKLINEHSIELVAVSMGADGALFVNKDCAIRSDALAIKAHSSVGAGDAMVAAMAYAGAQRFDVEEFVRLAVATSAGAVMSEGTKPPTKNQVIELKKQVKINYV